jgi:hypothetical protein
MTRGFYSVIQYVPDRFRAEAVNLGLVLLCPDPHGLRFQLSSSFDRVKRLFRTNDSELANLKISVESMHARLESLTTTMRTADELAVFAASRGNDIRLTEPRLAKLQSIDADFERLFASLVSAPAHAPTAAGSRRPRLPPQLSEVFRRLQREGRMWRPAKFTVPVSGQSLPISYAYKNGAVNLIKLHEFPAGRSPESQAARFALSGDLIQKHDVAGEQHKLVIVSTAETEQQAESIDKHVAPLLEEYHVRLIRPRNLADFAHDVDKTAH